MDGNRPDLLKDCSRGQRLILLDNARPQLVKVVTDLLVVTGVRVGSVASRAVQFPDLSPPDFDLFSKLFSKIFLQRSPEPPGD